MPDGAAFSRRGPATGATEALALQDGAPAGVDLVLDHPVLF